jgi:hypothetical protein
MYIKHSIRLKAQKELQITQKAKSKQHRLTSSATAATIDANTATSNSTSSSPTFSASSASTDCVFSSTPMKYVRASAW